MAQLLKKENITVVVGNYKDPQNPNAMKNRYKTIGELITMQGDDGSVYQFGEMWGPHGSTKFNVYEQQDNNRQQQPPHNQGYDNQPPPHQAAPQGYNQPPNNQPMGAHQR